MRAGFAMFLGLAGACSDGPVTVGRDGSAASDASSLAVDAVVGADAVGALDAGVEIDAAAAPLDSGPFWRACPPLPRGPRQETAVVARGEDVLVLGGFDAAGQVVSRVEALDLASMRWRDVADLPVPMHHAQAVAIGERVFVVGFLRGRDFREDGRTFVLDVDSWREAAPMLPGTERGGGAAVVSEGRVLVIGGLRGLAASREVTWYDPATDTHGRGPELPAPRDHLGAATVGDRVVVIGGRAARIESHVSEAWILDPNAMAWRMGAPMPTSRGGFALTTVGGGVYVIGGEGDARVASGVFPEVESYDVAEDRWSSLPPMPEPRHGTGAAAIGDAIVVPGGATRQAFGAVATCAILASGG